MPIVQNIPRKNGRINQRPGLDHVKPAIFGPPGNNKMAATVGQIPNPSDPLIYKSTGDTYNTLRTTSNKPPLDRSFNTATQRSIPARGNIGVTGLARPLGRGSQAFAEVMPHEHGSFFGHKPRKEAAVRTSGGVAPATDTAFHPVKGANDTYRPRRYPSKAGERTNAPSFLSTGHLTGNANQDATVSAVVSTGGHTSKWGGVKTSASDNHHPSAGQTGSHPDGTSVNVKRNAADLHGSGGLVSTGKERR